MRVRTGPKRGPTTCQFVNRNALDEAMTEGKLDGAQAFMGGALQFKRERDVSAEAGRNL